MHHHHDAEEKEFFPSIELISDVRGIMERNIEQHLAFTPGFDRFQEYSRISPKDYDGRKMRNLIEAFAEPLTRHLYDEIDTLRALDIYDSRRIRQAYQRFEKSLMATDNVRRTLLCRISEFVNFTNSVLVSNRTPRIRNRRQELRRRHARLPIRTLLCALHHSLLVRQEISWRLEIQSVHYLEGSQGIGLQGVGAMPLAYIWHACITPSTCVCHKHHLPMFLMAEARGQ